MGVEKVWTLGIILLTAKLSPPLLALPSLHQSHNTEQQARVVLLGSSSPLHLPPTSSAPHFRPLQPEIAPDEVKRAVEIGTGTFGKVYRGICRGKQVAIKALRDTALQNPQALANFKTEVKIMSQIFHPNICLFMGACTQLGSMFIVSEYLPGGDVEKLLETAQSLPLYRRMRIAKDAALGMNWLHCSNPVICHRDLKTSNLLIDDNGTIKVADFGLSEMKSLGGVLKDRDHAKGTPLYMSPEVMMFQPFNEKCDVYSFGIILWELLTRQKPFAHHTKYDVFRESVCRGERPPLPPDTEAVLAELINRCWAADPNLRPAFSEIVDRLDIVLANVAIEDPLGRSFWIQCFYKTVHEKYEVPWQKFASALAAGMHQAVEQNLPGFACLKLLLVDKKQERQVVKLDEFGRILKWFGPLSVQFLNNLRLVCSQPWFHGKADKDESEHFLSGKLSGSFLIRFSSIEGFFTVTVLTPERTIAHHRVEHVSGGPFVIAGRPYNSLLDIVAGESAWLTHPCEGSKFAPIFNSNLKGDYV